MPHLFYHFVVDVAVEIFVEAAGERLGDRVEGIAGRLARQQRPQLVRRQVRIGSENRKLLPRPFRRLPEDGEELLLEVALGDSAVVALGGDPGKGIEKFFAADSKVVLLGQDFGT